ncbi:KAP family P-loop NTPase fold protein [Pseudomonas rhizoryzae]|uniref:KAP family P-loop NTPase fold protein n=1 Tax=Pseudomonas rhizoryzae TaxID=2571129 RepID=UPI0009BFF67C|nr:P-loop NTPase fold protein [Pseudomonas rhizoryzae]
MAALWFFLKQYFYRQEKKLGGESLAVQSVEIGSDTPIRTKAEDRLRRSDYASRIADVLSELSLREGRVFAIRGGWGFGKSSLKYLVIEKLEANSGKADWLDFNPWQWGDGEAITRALFGQMADRLGGGYSRAAVERARTLRRYGEILAGASLPLKQLGAGQKISSILTNASVVSVAAAIGFSLPTAAIVAAVLAGLSIATSLGGNLLKYFGRDRSSEPLEKARVDLERRLRRLKRPLIVFVDDIDRLEPDQIRVLLKQVKSNANLPNIVFVLLFQPSIVEKALDPIAAGNGRAFLEKIVQANFDLPAVSIGMVHKIFAEQLSQLAIQYATEQNGFSDIRWGNGLIGCIQPHLLNMRDAYRLLSSIAVHIPLHADENLFEVNIIDFLVLETLRVFEPDLHEAIFRERSLFLQEHRYRGDGRAAGAKELLNAVIEIVPEVRRELARSTVVYLFPTIEGVLGNTHYGEGSRQQWLTEKRVCTSRFFPRYFELQTALGEISERRFVEFLEASSDPKTLGYLILEIEREGLLASLVNRLDESVGRLPVEHAPILLPGMFLIAQKFVGSQQSSFSSPWVSAWRATSWYLKNIPESIRGMLAIESLRTTKALSVAGILIHLSDPNDHRGSDKFDPALDLNTVNEMKSVWLQLVRDLATDEEKMISEPDLVSLLYRWKSFSGSIDEPRDWVSKVSSTDEGFVSLIKGMMSVGTSHAVGDRVSKFHNMFSKDNISDFIGLDEARKRCDSINLLDFPGCELALVTLRKHLDAWSKGEDSFIYL